jgi:hypothetical protein
MDQTRQHDSELASLYAQAGRLQFDALVINTHLSQVNTRIDQIRAQAEQEAKVKAKLQAEAAATPAPEQDAQA